MPETIKYIILGLGRKYNKGLKMLGSGGNGVYAAANCRT